MKKDDINDELSKYDKKEESLDECQKAKEKDIKVCRECDSNEKGYCKKYESWCNFARTDCPKIKK